jgi:hypothetical protein
MKMHQALLAGQRGLPGGDTLAGLLNRRFGVPIAGRPPNLTKRRILAWADAYHKRRGMWPRISSGAIPEAPGDTWEKVDVALRRGMRGLPGRLTLHRLLAQYGRGNLSWRARRAGLRARARWLSRTPLYSERILAWADAHYRRTGQWPSQNSGSVAEMDGLTWRAVDNALRCGLRGLPPGSSVPKFLARHGRGRKQVARPRVH